MKRINLRELYPFYKSDFYIEITDEVAELIKQINRKEHADYERVRVHKAYYSLDAGDGIEKDIVFIVLSSEEIYAHFFLGMSKAEIARSEGVSKPSIGNSIKQGLKSIEKYLKKFF